MTKRKDNINMEVVAKKVNEHVLLPNWDSSNSGKSDHKSNTKMNQEEICTAKMQNCITIKRCNSDYTDPHNTINLNNPFNIKVKHVPS